MTLAEMDHAAGPVAGARRSTQPATPAGRSTIELGESGIDLNEMVSALERDMIMKALEKAGGVRSKAAQLLGLNRTTLLEKIKKMGIDMQKR
jgi:DNA-binding NtrC family response regulator